MARKHACDLYALCGPESSVCACACVRLCVCVCQRLYVCVCACVCVYTAYLDKWQDLVQQSAAELLDPSRVSAAGGGGGGGGMGGHVLWEGESSEVGSSRLGEGTGPLQVPLLDTPVVGQLALRK